MFPFHFTYFLPELEARSARNTASFLFWPVSLLTDTFSVLSDYNWREPPADKITNRNVLTESSLPLAPCSSASNWDFLQNTDKVLNWGFSNFWLSLPFGGIFFPAEVCIQIIYHGTSTVHHRNNAFPYPGRNSCFLHREAWERVVLAAVLIEVLNPLPGHKPLRV